MSKPKQYRQGDRIACYEVVGPGEYKSHWIVRCVECGSEYERTTTVLRSVKRCNPAKCRKCYIDQGGARGQTEKAADIGVEWLPEGGFRSTELGLLQQRFYLGELWRTAA